jgi:hypothetical protein
VAAAAALRAGRSPQRRRTVTTWNMPAKISSQGAEARAYVRLRPRASVSCASRVRAAGTLRRLLLRGATSLAGAARRGRDLVALPPWGGGVAPVRLRVGRRNDLRHSSAGPVDGAGRDC